MARPARFGRYRYAFAATIILTTGLASPSVTAAPPSSGVARTVAGTAFGTTAPPGRAVTLITGDVVHLSASHGKSAVTVSPAPRTDGSHPSFWVTQRGQDLNVVPSDVAALVPSRIDPALFDVTTLLSQGYSDAQSQSIPLIATYQGSPAALPGTTATRRLESLRGMALRADKRSAVDLGQALVKLARSPHPTTKAAGLLAGVQKIWLDARVRVDLDDNLTQVGAPQAWGHGYTGAGVTVAVLDTGIDTTHPDLAGAVAESRDFTDTGDAGDHFGHGTHVASVIAGRGTASDGERKGVAYGATLLNGKVLDDSGNGYASWAIDGMEWASTTEHAEVVNMSLGFDPGSFAGSLVTDAVNRLTAENSTLFVVAAGNAGCDSCVASPGDAESALTVGAVDAHDQLADFSSRGPARGSYAVKPDITAPGVDIVGARAAGTSLGTPVGDRYVTLSGTSMATPHVAGAAALLLQARGAMSAQDAKAALMSTAVPSAAPVYAQGAGRLDIAAAVDSSLLASPGTLDYGQIAWPYDSHPQVVKTISYRNSADHSVTLTLSADVQGPDGSDAITVSPSSLIVPPGGNASANVVLDPTVGGPGLYGGAVTARAADGTTLRTTLGYHKEQEMHEVLVDGIARDGRAAVGGFKVINVRDGSVAAQRFWPGDPSAPCTDAAWGDSNCVRVPVGTYSVMGFIFTMPPDKASTTQERTVLNTSLVGDPQIDIDKDTTLRLDARAAQPVSIDTPGRETRANMGGASQIAMHRTPQYGVGETDQLVNFAGSQLEERLFLQPTAQVTLGDFTAYTRWRLEAPSIEFAVNGAAALRLDPEYYDPVWFSDVSAQYPRFDGTAQLRVVDAGTATADDLAGRDLRGAIALVRRSDAIAVGDQSNNAAAAGARLVAIYNDGPGVNGDPGEIGMRLQVPTLRLSHDEGVALLRLLARGGVTITVRGVVSSPYQYDLVYAERGRIPTDLHYVASLSRLAAVERHFHGQPDTDMTYGEAAYPYQPFDDYSISWVYPLTGAPRTRVDYHLGDPDVRWAYGVQTPEPPYNYIWPEPEAASVTLSSPTQVTYRPGELSSDDWFAGPIAPGLDPRQPLRRAGDLMRVHMAGFVDSAGNVSDAFSSQFDHGLTTDFRMYAGDQLIAQTSFLPAGTVAVPAGDTTYRIDYRVDNAAPWDQLSTRTSAQWTFTSHRPADGQVVTEPLITADYDVDLDLHNRLVSRTIAVDLGHQAGAAAAAITAATVDYSLDDGATWHSLQLRSAGAGRYTGVLDSRDRGFVSLRLHAADAAGGTLDQQIVRAFSLARQ